MNSLITRHEQPRIKTQARFNYASAKAIDEVVAAMNVVGLKSAAGLLHSMNIPHDVAARVLLRPHHRRVY
jgi:uncharacterized protein affecting Mg2+/Co2+ transport